MCPSSSIEVRTPAKLRADETPRRRAPLLRHRRLRAADARPDDRRGAVLAPLPADKQLHAAPERSMQGAKPSAFVAAQLRSLGYTVAEKVGKYDEPNATCYGVVAVMKNGAGPTVLVRSDMDALPVTE